MQLEPIFLLKGGQGELSMGLGGGGSPGRTPCADPPHLSQGDPALEEEQETGAELEP